VPERCPVGARKNRDSPSVDAKRCWPDGRKKAGA